MLRRVLALTMIFVFCLTGMTFAATVVNEDFSKPLDQAVWRVYSNSDTGEVAVANGVLTISDVDTGWKQKGIMLNKPIDLTGKTTTIEVAFKEANFNEQDFGLWTEGDIEEDDTYNHPGFRATVAPTNVGFQAMATFTAEGGSLEVTGDNNFVDMEAPFTIKWVLKPESDTVFNTQAFLNGQPGADIVIDFGDLSAKALYFYLYVSNNDQDGPVVVDNISITQE